MKHLKDFKIVDNPTDCQFINGLDLAVSKSKELLVINANFDSSPTSTIISHIVANLLGLSELDTAIFVFASTECPIDYRIMLDALDENYSFHRNSIIRGINNLVNRKILVKSPFTRTITVKKDYNTKLLFTPDSVKNIVINIKKD